MENKLRLHISRVLLMVLTAGIICFLLLFSYSDMKKIVRDENIQYLNEIATQSSRLVESRITDSFNTLHAITRMIESHGRKIDAPTNFEAIDALIENEKSMKLGVVTPDGIRYSFDGEKKDVSQQPYFAKMMQGFDVVAEVEPEEGEKASVVLVTPVFHDKKVIGGVVAIYPENALNELLTTTSFGGKGYSYLAKKQGDIIAYSENPRVDPNFSNYLTDFQDVVFDHTTDYSYFIEQVRRGNSGTIHYLWRGEGRYMSYRPVEINDWYLFSVVPDSIITQKSLYLITSAAAMCLVVAAMFILLIIYIRQMQKRSQAEIKKANFELRALSDNVPGGVLRFEEQEPYRIGHVSDGFLRLIGYTETELRTQLHNEYIHLIHPEDQQWVVASMKKQIVESNNAELEYRIIRGDRSERWVLARSRAIVEDEKQCMLYGVVLDVTENHRQRERERYREQRYHIILSQTKDVVFEWNMIDNTVYHSNYYKENYW